MPLMPFRREKSQPKTYPIDFPCPVLNNAYTHTQSFMATYNTILAGQATTPLHLLGKEGCKQQIS